MAENTLENQKVSAELTEDPSVKPVVTVGEPLGVSPPITLQSLLQSGALSSDESQGPKTGVLWTPRQALEDAGVITGSSGPTLAERAEALGTGAARGVAESGALLLSTIGGAKTGTALAPFAGPAAPFMPLAGGTAGFLYGLYASDFVGSLFPEAESEDLVSSYEGARTFAGGLAFAPSAMFFKAAPQGASVVRNAIGAIGEYARANKGKYYTSEAIASFYAGVAGGSMAEYFPESPMAKPIAEVAFSFLPSKFGPQLASSVKAAFKKGKSAVISATSVPSGQFSDSTLDSVRDIFVNVIEEAGEDPKQIVKAIDDFLYNQLGDTSVPTPTTAQVTGSNVLTKLQSLIARSNAKYSGDTKEMGEEALLAYDSIVKRLSQTNDPVFLATAANLRKDSIATQFQTAFNIAQTEALEKSIKLGTRGSDNRLVVGEILQGQMNSLLKIARESETQLWQTAIKGTFTNVGGKLKPTKIVPTNFADALYNVANSPFSSASRGDISKELSELSKDLSSLGFNAKKLKNLDRIEVTPEYLETGKLSPDMIKSLGLEPSSAIDMVRFRSSLLEKAREAGPNKPAAARRYSILANAILDDLDSLPEGQYADARAFSYGLNEAFKRTFAGNVTATDRRGVDVLAPELLVQRSFSGGADSTLKRMKEMESAADFVDPTGKASRSVRDAERKVVQAFASEALNLDGSVDVGKLDRFRAQNADALKYLNMEGDFKDISSAERTLLDVKNPDSLLNTRIKSEKAFADLLEVDDPAIAVSMALTDPKAPTKNFKSLVETASSPADPVLRKAARDGLLSTVYQYAYQTALKGGGFSPQAFNDILFKPLSPNNPSIANLLRAENLFSSDELSRLKQLSNRMLNVEKALKTQGRIIDPTKVFTPQDAVESLVVAMIGANFASLIGPGGSGSLTFASRAIKFFDNLFSKAPARQKLLLLEEITKNPILFKQMMSRNPTVAEAKNTQLSVLRFLYPGAILPTAIDRYVETMEDEPVAPPPPTARGRLNKMPPPTPSRGVPGLTNQGAPAGQPSTTDQAPPPGPQSAAPQPPSQSRQMLSALFPEDRLLGVQ